MQWSLVAGRIPPGMDAPISQGQTAGMVSGRPTTEGTYGFSVRVTDSAGATDVETFTIDVVAPRPLSVTTPATLPPATRGLAYQVNLGADGGLPGYAWALRSGTLPPGLRLSSAPVAAVAGTPTAPGTFTFTVTVTDSRGTAIDKYPDADRQLSRREEPEMIKQSLVAVLAATTAAAALAGPAAAKGGGGHGGGGGGARTCCRRPRSPRARSTASALARSTSTTPSATPSARDTRGAARSST